MIEKMEDLAFCTKNNANCCDCKYTQAFSFLCQKTGDVEGQWLHFLTQKIMQNGQKCTIHFCTKTGVKWLASTSQQSLFAEKDAEK